MAIPGPYIQVPLGLQVNNAQPVDRRTVVSDVRDRTNVSGANVILNSNVFDGLLVYQQDNETLYAYVGPVPGTDTNGIANEDNWRVLNSSGIDVEGDIFVDGTVVPMSGSIFSSPVIVSADGSFASNSYTITIGNLTTGATYEIVSITAENSPDDWVTSVDVGGQAGTITSPASYDLSTTVGGNATEIFSVGYQLNGGASIFQTLQISRFLPVFAGVQDDEPTEHVSSGSMFLDSDDRIPFRGMDITLTYIGSNISYGVINIPTNFQEGMPSLIAGGFTISDPTTYAPTALGDANNFYRTFVVPVRQDTVVTLN